MRKSILIAGGALLLSFLVGAWSTRLPRHTTATAHVSLPTPLHSSAIAMTVQ